MNIWLTKCTNNLYEHIFCTFSFWWLFKYSSVFVCYYIFTVVSHKSDLTDQIFNDFAQFPNSNRGASFASVHKFKVSCFFSMVNVTVMWRELIMNPKKVILT